MRHAIKTSQLKQVMGCAYQLGVTFKPSSVVGFMELKSWPQNMKAKDVKEHFSKALGVDFELVG